MKAVFLDIGHLIGAFFVAAGGAAFFTAVRELIVPPSTSLGGAGSTFFFCWIILYFAVGGLIYSWALGLYYLVSLVFLYIKSQVKAPIAYAMHSLLSAGIAVFAVFPRSLDELMNRHGDNAVFSFSVLIGGLILGPLHCYLRYKEHA